MSNEHLKTNHEIVNELTESLEESLKASDMQETMEENGEDNEFERENSTEDEDLNIDENSIAELEKNLTEDEIENRKQQALELKKVGNSEYNEKKYLESVITYTNAIKICPMKFSDERSIFYANRAASKINVNRIKSAIEDCTKSIELNDKYLKSYVRRAKLYEGEDKLDESLEDFKKALEINPHCVEALEACQRLPPKIEERNEKLKTEMLGKLKDLGNMILKPFGLSTNNFNLEQNPDTGSYSVNFSQNTGANS